MAATAPFFIADMLQLLLLQREAGGKNWGKRRRPVRTQLSFGSAKENAECCIAVMLSLQRATVAGDANVPPHRVARNAARCFDNGAIIEALRPLPQTLILS